MKKATKFTSSNLGLCSVDSVSTMKRKRRVGLQKNHKRSMMLSGRKRRMKSGVQSRMRRRRMRMRSG